MRYALLVLGTALVGFASVAAIACASFEEEVAPSSDGGDGQNDGSPCIGCDAASLDPPVEISAGTVGCALRKSGKVVCWGDNARGSVGADRTGDQTCPGTALCRPNATEVVGIADARQISVGSDFACALTGTGNVMCWGYNEHATLGTTTRTAPSFEARRVDLPPALEVSAGLWSACARVQQDDGVVDVYCWGSNSCAQIGVADGGSLFGPTKIEGLQGAKAVRASATGALACAISATDNVYCWGSNAFGALGHAPGSNGDRPASSFCAPSNPTPTLIDTGEFKVVELAVGADAACARKADGSVHCWGSNQRGGLGSGGSDETAHPEPEQVANLPAARSISSSTHVCAIDTGGFLHCWGSNGYGELANGFNGRACFFGIRCNPTPGPASALKGITRVAAGSGFTLAIAEGNVYAWGLNRDGRLGHAPNTSGDETKAQCAGDELCNSEPRLVHLP